MRLVALLCVLMVFLAPTAAADRDGRTGQGNDDAQRRDGNHQDRDDRDGGGGQGQENETSSLTLDGTIDQTAAKLEWVFRGDEGNVTAFEIYRSVNEGAVELIATVDAAVRTFTDSLPTGPAGSSGSYTYSAQATMVGSSSASQTSNSVTMILLTCQWISVSPFGTPPLLIHDECSPLQ